MVKEQKLAQMALDSLAQTVNAINNGQYIVVNSTLNEAVGYLKAIINSNDEQVDDLIKIADEVIAGKWGNGLNRIKKLERAGYDSAKVQNIVNVMQMIKSKGR